MNRITYLFIVLGVLAGMLLSGVVVHLVIAAPANPDSITLHTARVFQNIFETGDMLFLVSYDVAYASEPDEPADETFQLALYDTDGTTLLYNRELNYYQYNVHSIYLEEELADDLVWESEYKLRIMGNPIYFTPTEDVTMDTITLSPSTHWLSGSMADSRTLLQYHCLDLAATLEDEWVITLITTVPDGQVLNSVGRTVFLDAVPGLDSALTDLFQVAISQLVNPDTTGYNGTYEAETNLADRLGAQVAAAFTQAGEPFGVSGQTVALIWIAFFALTIASVVFLSTGNTTASLVLVTPTLILGARVGAIPLALLFVAASVIVIYMMYQFWLKGL